MAVGDTPGRVSMMTLVSSVQVALLCKQRPRQIPAKSNNELNFM